MSLTIIVAVARNGVIGREGGLPWRMSADLRRFKSLTMGHTVMMGRRTYDSIGRKLPGRTCVVVTRDPAYAAPGCHVVPSLDAALVVARHDQRPFVIGGRQLYEQTLPLATEMEWTAIDADVEGDVCFPEVDWNQWQLVAEQSQAADERNEFACCFRRFRRVVTA